VSGGGDRFPIWPILVAALLVAALDFAVIAKGSPGVVVLMAACLLSVSWRAWLAWRTVAPTLVARRIDPAPVRSRFLRIPVAAALGCLLLGLGVPLFAHWSGDGIAAFRGSRMIEHAASPALYWFTSACWFAVTAGVLWFGLLFATGIERLRKDPQRNVAELLQPDSR
jgi:hypothetical protein